MSTNFERHAQAPDQPNEAPHLDNQEEIVVPDTPQGATRLNPNMRGVNPHDTFTEEEISKASGISEKHPGRTKMIAGIAIGAVGTAAVAGGALFGYNKFREETNPLLNALNNRPTAEAPLVPGGDYSAEGYTPSMITGDFNGDGKLSNDEMDRMNYQSFAELDEVTRLSYIGEYMNKWESATWDIMQDYMTPEQAAVMSFPQGNKRDFTAEEILSSNAINIFQASAQGDDTEKGRKLLSIVVDPGVAYYDKLAPMIGSGVGGLVSVDEVVTDHGRIYNQEILGHTFGTAGGHLVRARNVAQGKEFYNLFKLIENDSSQSWMLVGTYSLNDRQVLNAIKQLN